MSALLKINKRYLSLFNVKKNVSRSVNYVLCCGKLSILLYKLRSGITNATVWHFHVNDFERDKNQKKNPEYHC